MDATVAKVTATTRRELISGLSRFAPLVSEALSFIRLHQVLRLCKLYDYEGRRWLDFDGVPTTPAVHLHCAPGRAAVPDPALSVT